MKAEPRDHCRKLLEQVSRYLDGDLTPAERRTITQHLRQCPCCQTMADSLQHTVEVCRKAGGARLPADVRSRAKARIATLLSSGPVHRPRT
ncbi:MAG: zf-HC2 domain-containing protein [Acidobacteria bacterium]|nr:zf-HC2 domain-containing protein [Acidobacteriota bacterium]